MRALAALLLVTACGSGPLTTSATTPRLPPPAPNELEPPAEPAPEPLSFEDISFEQRWSFVAPNLGELEPHLMAEAELTKRLPASVRAAYQAVEPKRSAYRELVLPGPGQRRDPATITRARKAVERAIAHAKSTLDAELAKRPSGAVGIALARLRQLDSLGSRGRIARAVRYGSIVEDARSLRVVEPLERAVEATRASDELGRHARVELAHHLMATSRAREAEPLLRELLPVMPRDQVPQIHFRLGVLHSLSNDHEAAAASFRAAHEGLATSSKLSRHRLIAAELFARYRAGQYARVLTLASEAWNESKKPAPLEPDPNPPPPPKPKPKPKANRNLWSGEIGTGIIGVLSANGDFPSLFGSSALDPFGERQLVTLATDAVERLGRDPSTLQAPEALRARLLSELAVRAYYRGDLASAKSHGLAAEALDPRGAHGALRVLRKLALRDGDRDRVEALDRAIDEARHWNVSGTSIEEAFLDSHRATRTDSPMLPSVTERAVRSLMRLCLEPIHARFPTSTERDRTIAEIALTAKVFPEGRVELEPILAASDLASEIRDVYTCAAKLAPKLLAHATSSARVQVAIKSLAPPRGFDSGLGDSFGYGGLGGGTGSAIGIGSRGSGTGAGYGRGSTP